MVRGTITLTELPVIPMTQNEVKQVLKDQQNQDEERVINHLANNIDETSIASEIYKK